MGRVAVFIDGAYFEYVSKQEFGSPRIAFELLAQALARGSDLLRAYYYHCLPWQSSQPTQEESERFANRQRFFDVLRKLPRFEVRLGQLAYRGTTAEGNRIFVQKQVDILLGSDLVLLAAKHLITDAALLAGDSDFLPAVRIAKNEGVAITLWHGTKNPPHNELWNCADERIRLSEELIESVRLP